jgi:DNA-binding NarL/FixJ family response regulator
MNANASIVIAVTSDRSLVADAVSAALVGSRLVVVRIPWPGAARDREAGWAPGTVPPALGLMLCDLDASSVEAAQWVVTHYPTRWLLLTDAPRGPLWGAMIEAGVVGVLQSTTTIAEVLDAIVAVQERGTLNNDQRERVELVRTWREEQSEREEAVMRLATLTPRERDVLRLIHVGFTVREIAVLNGVAPSTVRSQVRSVLRKLGVNSQLAASALFEKWGGV